MISLLFHARNSDAPIAPSKLGYKDYWLAHGVFTENEKQCVQFNLNYSKETGDVDFPSICLEIITAMLEIEDNKMDTDIVALTIKLEEKGPQPNLWQKFWGQVRIQNDIEKEVFLETSELIGNLQVYLKRKDGIFPTSLV